MYAGNVFQEEENGEGESLVRVREERGTRSGKVFKNWSSNQRSNPAPVWRDPKFSETSIEVGVLGVNHPEPGSDIIPEIPLSSARAAGAPTMLGLTLNLEEGSYAFLWRDSNCKFINPKYVRLNDEYTMATARATAIEHYNGRAIARIMSFNTDLIISAARRRIRKWAVSGSQTRADLDEEDIVTAGEVRKLVFASDFLAECQIALQETMQELSGRDPFVLSF
ncbi:uncharacterized protein NECHADRAFT_77437 [Fusarium vanettenii 77-13-4]|uniref:Uncharacterized protein n=1 Tax=Fusarium vanettenii (strain ATCC MYA-4622 / CBS 123669 / FGSC 9596 / NRRL 45880 / 77-13-4) TaxID=660122 RepID=C7YL81_FUSV7|nr:uncharacterized protein NECHADRAFT_77437 [Fusarium vanettenii 77-13-4]EEU47212.1 hypothetical protein NECHADRAFT_77437 [Fusarium vanettenii 77-13-4]